jgi:hypothetical protein
VPGDCPLMTVFLVGFRIWHYYAIRDGKSKEQYTMSSTSRPHPHGPGAPGVDAGSGDSLAGPGGQFGPTIRVLSHGAWPNPCLMTSDSPPSPRGWAESTATRCRQEAERAAVDVVAEMTRLTLTALEGG